MIIHKNPSINSITTGIEFRDLKGGFGNKNDGLYINIKSTNSVSNSTHCTMVKWNNVLIGRSNGVQVWSKLEMCRDLKSIFQSFSSNENNLLKLLHFLYEEICFDKLQMATMLNKYYMALNKKRQTELKTSTELLAKQSKLNSSFTMKQYTHVNAIIDKSFELAIRKCYIEFNEITLPLISNDEILRLVDIYKDQLHPHYSIMKQMMNFDSKEKQIKFSHLKMSGFYDKILFFLYLAQSRIRNKKSFINWGMVATAANYGRGHGNSNTTQSTYFGVSTTLPTFLNKTNSLRENMTTNIHNYLKEETKFFCCIDNNQKGHSLKYQRYGTSNKFIKVTGSVIKKFIHVDMEHTFNSKVKLSYQTSHHLNLF